MSTFWERKEETELKNVSKEGWEDKSAVSEAANRPPCNELTTPPAAGVETEIHPFSFLQTRDSSKPLPFGGFLIYGIDYHLLGHIDGAFWNLISECT